MGNVRGAREIVRCIYVLVRGCTGHRHEPIERCVKQVLLVRVRVRSCLYMGFV